MSLIRSVAKRVVRAFRKASLPCVLVFTGTVCASLGLGYLLSGAWETGLRVGLVLGALFTLAAFLLVNPLFVVDEASLEPSNSAVWSSHFGSNPWDAPLSDYGGINPATGLPMFGGLDSGGNPYGTGSSKMNWPD
jgi:hypothetical protein